MNRIAAVFFVLIISACCRDRVLKDHFKVTDAQKGTLPHKTDSSYTFLAPNNQPFSLKFYNEKTTQHTMGGHYCGDPYSVFDEYERVFVADVPDLIVRFRLWGNVNSSLTIYINNNYFGAYNFGYPDLDTITINGVLYQDVFTPATSNADSTTLYFDKIWYNRKHGLLQFTTNNGQVFKRQ